MTSRYHQSLSDQELAEMHLGYLFGDEAIADEFHRRNPRLAGWKAAADHLSRLHYDAWEAEHGFQLDKLGPDSGPFGWDALVAEYRKSVERIAVGQ